MNKSKGVGKGKFMTIVRSLRSDVTVVSIGILRCLLPVGR
jgi:hypothetical protein